MRKSPTKGVLFQLFAPILGVLGGIFIVGYKLLIGWWADPIESNRQYEALKRDINENLVFLFTEHGASIRPREGRAARPGFDYAIVTVLVENLVLQFVRGR